MISRRFSSPPDNRPNRSLPFLLKAFLDAMGPLATRGTDQKIMFSRSFGDPGQQFAQQSRFPGNSPVSRRGDGPYSPKVWENLFSRTVPFGRSSNIHRLSESDQIERNTRREDFWLAELAELDMDKNRNVRVGGPVEHWAIGKVARILFRRAPLRPLPLGRYRRNRS